MNQKHITKITYLHIARHIPIIFFLLFCFTGAFAMQDSISVSLKKQDITIARVFKVLQEQTGFIVFYNNQMLNDQQKMDVNFKHAGVKQVMDYVIKGRGLTYVIKDRFILLRKKNDESRPLNTVKESLNTALNTVDTVITGIVKNEAGEPLIGVSVGIKGVSLGTITSAGGRFSISVPDLHGSLVFSYVGYSKKEVSINGRPSINVVMKASVSSLNQLVVVGYGTQQKKDLTGSIGTYKPSELNSRPVSGPDQMLQGRISGVSVSYGSGTPGGAMRVSVRGVGSISAGNSPLYVIDGVPVTLSNVALSNFGEDMDPLAALNPDDIASIDVLKDASAAAIYGSRATNGVVIITTKSGQKGKPKLNLSLYTGVQHVPRLDKLQMAGSDLYIKVINEAIDNYNMEYGYNPGNANYAKRIEDPYPGLPDVNWLDLVLRDAWSSNANLSFSGGSDKGTYYISGGYLNQQGAIITNDLKRYSGRINLTQRLFPWLKVGTNTNFSFSHNNRVPGSNLGSAIMARSLEQRPFDRPYKPDGSYYVGGTAELMRHNTLQILNEEKAYLDNSQFLGNFYADIRFLKNFTFKSSFGTNVIYTHDYMYYMQDHPYSTGTGRLVDRNRHISNVLFENVLNYKNHFGMLSVTALAGHSFQKVSSSNNSIDGRGFPSPSFDVLSVASEIADAYTGLSAYALESYFGRANLSWNDRYLLMLSVRADGSSRFDPDHRFGYFPAASLGWNISRERFWMLPETDLKLRLSYGATGNQEGISNYAYQALAGGGYNYNNKSGIAITTFGNDALTWEKATQLDAGMDISLKSGIVNLTIDYFNKNTTNLLYDMPIQGTSGFTSITSNIGSMRNHGLEFGANTNINLGHVKWASDFNISFIRNEITSLVGDNSVISIGANRGLKVGYDIGSFWVYKMLGIYQNDKEVPKPLYDLGIRAGDVKYEDVNGDGNIDINDREIVGSSNPKFFGGWNNTFQYKGFDFSVFLTYSYGAEIYAPWRITVSRLGNGYYAFLKDVALDRWTGPGTSNTTPRAIYGNTYNVYNSTRWLEDASYIRLRALTLGYNLPRSILAKIGFQELRIYLQGDNLYLLTNYSGLDPEVSDNLDPRFMGDDNLVIPQLRTINVGVNVTF